MALQPQPEQLNQEENMEMEENLNEENMFEEFHHNIGDLAIIHEKEDQSSIFKGFDI